MKRLYRYALPIVLLTMGANCWAAEISGSGISDGNESIGISSENLSSKVYRHGEKSAEIIQWRNEGAITILSGEKVLYRRAYFSNTGYNGAFIESGQWSPKGSYFAFRLLSSGGHMPYRTPVKIFRANGEPPSVVDAEMIIRKIPGISNIAVGPYKKPYFKWLSDNQLQVSVISNDKKSDTGFYIVDLDTLTASYQHPETEESDASAAIVPPRGSKLRKKILNALRKEVTHQLGHKVVFVVAYMKVKNNWAWLHTLPQSPGGSNHYEDIFALMSKSNGKWKVAEIACMEEGDDTCLQSPTYYEGLKRRFPGLPPEILPKD